MPQAPIQPAILSLPGLINSISGAAAIKAAAEHTSRGWEPFSKSDLVNFLTAVVTDEIGFPVVRQDHAAIEAARIDHASKMLKGALESAWGGPDKMARYLSHLDADRTLDIVRLMSIYDNAMRVGDEIEARLTLTMHALIVMRTAATIGLALTPLAPLVIPTLEVTAGEAGVLLVLNLVYGSSQQYLRSLASSNKPNVVAFDITDELKKGGRDFVTDAGQRVSAGVAKRDRALLDDAKRKIAVMSRRLNRDLSESKAAQLNRRFDRATSAAAQAESGAKFAGGATIAFKSFSVVSALVDVYGAVEDARQDW